MNLTRKNGATKIGSGVLKSQIGVTSNPMDQKRRIREINSKNIHQMGAGTKTTNQRALNNNSNTSTNENSLPPKGKIGVGNN